VRSEKTDHINKKKHDKRKILVTSALPYANGDIHIGHLVEYLQTDFWVRYQKMRGNECLYMCADDTHGTPVMISANKLGITPEELISEYHKRHMEDFTDFQITFDNYYSTNSPENRELSETIFAHMQENGHVDKRAVKQNYCENDRMFLPDRFVTGTCPRCGSEDQYGDSCDVCSSTYSSFELVDAKCTLCGVPPVAKESEHLFFVLNNFRDFLVDWVKTHTPEEVKNKLQEWLKQDLRDWDISRDAPYFGFEIPGYKNKYFYVWVDAPIGYMSATKNWCEKNGRDFAEFWKDTDTELYHFIGKDIIYFHTLFWPAMLHNSAFRTPDQVFVHGFLTINGEKMSKSKGTFIKARTYLDHLEPLYLRYYYACKLTSSMDDIDLNFDDFVQRVNSDLIGKITNLASRGAQMLNKIDAGRST
jgi:methionyl-tRNA synthetase